jgi:hypothetical protein
MFGNKFAILFVIRAIDAQPVGVDENRVSNGELAKKSRKIRQCKMLLSK